MVISISSVSNRAGTSNVKIRGHHGAVRGRDRKSDDPGRGVHRHAGGLFDAVRVDLHRAVDGLGDDAGLEGAAAGIVLDQLERRVRAVAGAERLRQGLEVGPVLEPEAVGAALAGTKERDQCRHLIPAFETVGHVPLAAGLGPVGVALLVTGDGGDDGGRVARSTGGAVGDVRRKLHLMKGRHGRPLHIAPGTIDGAGHLGGDLALAGAERVGIVGAHVDHDGDRRAVPVLCFFPHDALGRHDELALAGDDRNLVRQQPHAGETARMKARGICEHGGIDRPHRLRYLADHAAFMEQAEQT